MKKVALLATSVALALSGCGSSDSDNNNTSNTATANKDMVIKAIDGYLIGAEVYVDRNTNGIADGDSERLAAVTDDKGEITISSADTQYPVIVRAVAGKTYDTDKGGRLTQTTEMMAGAGSSVVTPFTTLAAVKNISLGELASQLNLPQELIAGDYVASKNDQETAQAAKKVHILARSLTQELGNTIADSKQESTALLAKSDKIIKAVDEAINDDKELDDIIIAINDEGNATVQPMPPTVKEHFSGKTFYSLSTNNAYFANEGLITASFTDTEVNLIRDNGKQDGPWPLTYTSKGFQNGTDGLDEVIYMSDAFTLVVTGSSDLYFHTTTNIDAGYEAKAADAAMFQGKTYYHFWDDATDDNANPCFVTLTFDQTGNQVTVTEGDKSGKYPWSVSDGKLTIEDTIDGDNWIIQPTTLGNDDMMVFYEGSSNQSVPYFMTENKDLAYSLFGEWVALAK